ncbi:MAG: DUF4012 domain-containing protein [Chloroflexota bacterium]|nr:DUF4012 domain-containing protein [Chloroflexota bacterium]
MALFVTAGLAVVTLVAIARYRPLIDDAMALRIELRSIASRVSEAGPRLDAASLGAIQTDADRVKARYARVAGALAHDPLVGLARLIPGLDRQVRAADDLSEAAGLLLGVMDDGLRLGDGFVHVRDQPPGASTIEGLVGLAAGARGDLATATARVDRALSLLDRIPDDAVGPIRAARDEARDQLGRYQPILEQAAQAVQFVPDFLGWDRPKRYLVLAQNPAELRPTGGYIGQFGLVAFSRGRIVEMTFRDMGTIYTHPGPAFVVAPAPLRNHLLGPDQSWRFADGNWSPDFPTAARQTARLYGMEPDSEPIDGVIGLTTYAIDELLSLTGPIDVRGYNVTVKPGNATFDLFAATRGFLVPGGDRKAILGVFAHLLIDDLYALPSTRWLEFPAHFERIRAEHDAAIWMSDPDSEAAISKAGWDGSLAATIGDQVVIAEANVGPVSKLHLVTDRAIDLRITLDEAGNAHGQLELRYNNHIQDQSADRWTREVAKFLLGYQRRENLGLYVRVLVPLAAHIAEVTFVAGPHPIGGLEAIDEELGRRSFGAYAMVPPGKATLGMAWVTPGMALRAPDGRWRYSLSLPKPPGRLADPLRVAIQLPPGMHVVDVSDPTLRVTEEAGAAVVVYEAPFRSDVAIDLQYEASPGGG